MLTGVILIALLSVFVQGFVREEEFPTIGTEDVGFSFLVFDPLMRSKKATGSELEFAVGTMVRLDELPNETVFLRQVSSHFV